MVPDRPLKITPRLRDGLIVLTCVAAHALYLLLTRYGYHRFGFPLDDAWIYQTYARNLAQSGQWAFIPGLPSTGSTSILWTLLLAPAYWLPLDPRWWTQALGLLTLIAVSLGGARLFKHDSPLLSLAVGLALALDWHLVWAAASGMETGLFAALLIWFWVWWRRNEPASGRHYWRNVLLLGIWGGVLMLARPEGVLALAVAGLYGLLASSPSDAQAHTPDGISSNCAGPPTLLRTIVQRLSWGIMAALGFALLLIPFFAFNHVVSGRLWPNTFYAKQTEYAVLWAIPYPERFLQQVSVSFVGAQLLLIPGLLATLWDAVRRRDWSALAPWGWVLLHWAIYAARLPVTYQHGRYAIPVMPLVVIYSLRGAARLAKPHHRSRPIRLISLSWLLAATLLFPLVLGLLGAPAYARDVTFIEDEMVATALWLQANTDPSAVIAAHDIGAIGYFAPRRLIDLAGLISPDVIPFMHSDQRLASYIIHSGADYLVIFPRWNDVYARLVTSPHFCPIWSTARQAGYITSSGLGPMTVYAIRFDTICPADRQAYLGSSTCLSCP